MRSGWKRLKKSNPIYPSSDIFTQVLDFNWTEHQNNGETCRDAANIEWVLLKNLRKKSLLFRTFLQYQKQPPKLTTHLKRADCSVTWQLEYGCDPLDICQPTYPPGADTELQVDCVKSDCLKLSPTMVGRRIKVWNFRWAETVSGRILALIRHFSLTVFFNPFCL